MPSCDLCGKESSLVKAAIEGSVMGVCSDCGKHGKILRNVPVNPQVYKPRKIIKEEVEESVVSDFSNIIRNERNKKGMKQEEFALLLNERESLVQKWESGSLQPRIGVARKIEKILGIHLVEGIEKSSD